MLQFSINQHNNNKNNSVHHHHSKHDNHHPQHQQQVWFTEWSENKIGKVDAGNQLPPFSVIPTSIHHNKEITIKRGESKEIKLKVIATAQPTSASSSSSSDNMNIHMVASGTFTSTGDLGNSTGYFSEECDQY